MDILILVGGFTIVCLMGMPVAYALGIAAIAAALYAGIPLEAVMLKVAGGMSGFSLLAIPFFILTGAIMAVGGMAERLVNLAKVFVGFIRGGMALVNILASTMFGCISGSSVADTAAVGSVMIPQMIKNGYPRLFAVNVTISGSLQPLLVPPSHNMIIYSIAAGGTISVAHLFMLVWGIKLCQATWHQDIPEFPIITVGLSYLPIPIGGALTVLFVIERFLTQKFFAEPEPETVSQLTTE